MINTPYKLCWHWDALRQVCKHQEQTGEVCNFYHPKICPEFQETGRCSAMGTCRLAHKQRQTCRFFQEGKCTKGDACTYSHSTTGTGSKVNRDKATFTPCKV